MIEVAKRTTSLCPRCGYHMLYFNSLSQLQVPDESGKNVSAVLNEVNDIFAVCPKCKSSYKMRRTVYGILPEGMADEQYLGTKDPKYEKYNPIGQM